MFRAIPTRIEKIMEDSLGSVGKDKPQQFMFLEQRPKKAALDEVRNIEVEKENHVLLSKIKNIGEKGCKNSYSKLVEPMDPSKRKTLNEPYRKRQLVKIVQENQQIMKRIQSKKSMYNARRWEKQRMKIEKNITLISSFPYKNYPSTQTQVNLWMTSENLSQKKDHNRSLSQSRSKYLNLNFSGTKKINDSYYLLTSYIQKKYFYIDIENLEDPQEKYRMQLEESEVMKLLHTIFEYNIHNLFACLQIDQTNRCCFLKYEVEDAEQKINQVENYSIEIKGKSRVSSKIKKAKNSNLQK